TLNSELQQHISAIEQHNRELRAREAAIPVDQRGGLTVDTFCGLAADDAIDAKIQEADRKVAAAQAADVIRRRDAFRPLRLPEFDIATIRSLLARTLPDLQADAAAQVRDHLRRLGRGGEAWVGEGMTRLAGIDVEGAGDTCPFCAQGLATSPILRHYEAYFSYAYNNWKSAINDSGRGVAAAHGAEEQASFGRALHAVTQDRQFWVGFTGVPDINFDAGSIRQHWTVARDAILSILRTKASAPLEAMILPDEAIAAVEAYLRDVQVVSAASNRLIECNDQIAQIKAQAAAADLVALKAELMRLRAVKARHLPPLNDACDAY